MVDERNSGRDDSGTTNRQTSDHYRIEINFSNKLINIGSGKGRLSGGRFSSSRAEIPLAAPRLQLVKTMRDRLTAGRPAGRPTGAAVT